MAEYLNTITMRHIVYGYTPQGEYAVIYINEKNRAVPKLFDTKPSYKEIISNYGNAERLLQR